MSTSNEVMTTIKLSGSLAKMFGRAPTLDHYNAGSYSGFVRYSARFRKILKHEQIPWANVQYLSREVEYW